MPSKYKALRDFLQSLDASEVTLSFSRIEELLAGPLPASAYRYREWWSNQTDVTNRPQARAWISAGFLVDAVHQAGSRSWVRFRRSDTNRSQPQVSRSTAAKAQRPIERKRHVPAESRRVATEGKGGVPAVYLVTCVSSKRDALTAAKDLYVSDWFQKARAYVETTGMPWFILSAEHGLLDPDECVGPYDRTLNKMTAGERQAWARKVILQMEARLPDAARVAVLAGQRYREYLLDYLNNRFPIVDLPLKGLRIGEQLQWFGQRLANGRLAHLERFYGLLSQLESRLGGTRCLADCHVGMNWPQRGVYFFFEPGEHRTQSGNGPRVVRVGTHALTAGSRSTLWQRLSQHRGSEKSGGGNHRGSIFRLLVGEALKEQRGEWLPGSWGLKEDSGKAAAALGLSAEEVKAQEHELEGAVSARIRAMPFLWLAIEDEPGPDSRRGYVERNAIALLSDWDKTALDAPSDSWLGRYSKREKVRKSGLWNNNHVEEDYDAAFLDVLEELVYRM